MAEKKKNDATSILAKIRQKMNKIDKSNSDDDILLNEDNDDLQNISTTTDNIENYQPIDSVSNNISETKPSHAQTLPSVKKEQDPINNNLKFEDEDIFQGTTLDDEFVVPKSDKNKKDTFDDEDLKFDIDLEIEDKTKIESDTKQKENDFDDLDNIDLEGLEESDDKAENKIIEGEASRIEKPTASSKSEVSLNTQKDEFDELEDLLEDSEDKSVQVKQHSNLENEAEEQDIDDLGLEFLEDEDETQKQTDNLPENSTANEIELDELDKKSTKQQESFLRTSSTTNISSDYNEEEKDEDEEIFEEESQEEQDDKEDEQKESKNEEVNDEKADNNSQQFYQQQSKPSMISKKVIDETQQSIKKLVQAIPKKQEMLFERSPAFRSGETIEDMVISMLRPKLEQWFNENLPVMVERIVREEIKKIVPKNEDY